MQRQLSLSCLAVFFGGCGTALDVDDRLGAVRQEITAISGSVIHANRLHIDHLDSAWVPAAVGNGTIVNLWTQSSFDEVHYSVFRSTVTPNSSWFDTPPGAGFPAPAPPNSFTRSSLDLTSPWAPPENFCDLYNCDPTTPVDVFRKHATAGAVLAPGPVDLVAAVTITLTDCAFTLATTDCFDIAVTSSTDGGDNWDHSRLISEGASGGGEDNRFIVPDSVHATTLITQERGSKEQLRYSAPIFITWKTAREPEAPQPEAWWLAKVLVDPSNGRIALLNGPRNISNQISPDQIATVTLQAWHNLVGQETVGMVTSQRLDARGTPLADVRQRLPQSRHLQYCS